MYNRKITNVNKKFRKYPVFKNRLTANGLRGQVGASVGTASQKEPPAA
jgi:hypothetical protein